MSHRGDGWGGMGAKKVCVPEMGLSLFGSRFKISFFPRGKIFGCVWVGGLALVGGSARSPPPPPTPLLPWISTLLHLRHRLQETVATVSFAGKYLVVKDMEQAEYLANYILNGGDKDEFLKYYGAEAMSAGFDPEAMLDKIGLANQTTMLKGETVAIGKLLESTMMQKFGPQVLGPGSCFLFA